MRWHQASHNLPDVMRCISSTQNPMHDPLRPHRVPSIAHLPTRDKESFVEDLSFVVTFDTAWV